MNAVDTNILIYVNDPRDPDKQAIAVSCMNLELEWEFAEIWVDPWLSPPYILMLIKEQASYRSLLSTRIIEKAIALFNPSGFNYRNNPIKRF
ncbi:hypothetical protein PCC9214_03501 [Planktothrix tepida]|uniref:PIN domain-containing protein n=2 Tax=Planktothrix TaxID=54304 RepID=A0A1J1LR49_9CYAN|nr:MULTISPECIES: hypothetical protein [Planktothrix]CAD5944688.1 hypothetical protein NO713_02152 [Planktothrix pseudagardhii]CAD5966070.1 hypothetical protein PCC9214_03501 [Planktothrix tepida]CUR35051.1 hypothetical protein PL9214650490 [Planktothrix tepida PCC 9214]